VAVTILATACEVRAALPDTAKPTLSLARTIRTTPFTGTTSSMRDGEGSAFVPSVASHPNKDGTDSLWLIEDDGKSAWEINPYTGALKSHIAQTDWAATKRLGCTATDGSCAAGKNRTLDLESMAYDDATDTLYAFNGKCCSSTVLPTVFRLKRRADGSFFPESFQPLASASDFTAAAWNPSDRRLYVGVGSDLRTYNYETNSAGSAFRVSGLSGILGMTFHDGDLFVVDSGVKLLRVDWLMKTLRSGWTLDLKPFGMLDSRAVEVVRNPTTGADQFYALDGYDGRTSGDPLMYSVFVLDVCCGPTAGPPVASFAVSTTPGSRSVTFTDTSTGNPTSWSWEFGDSMGSMQQNPTHGYAADGTYTVTLTARNDAGSSSATQTVSVPPPPSASFTWAQRPGTTEAQFTDTSSGGPSSWSWSFGDSATSSAQSPSHVYAGTGSFSVTLRVDNDGGFSTATQTVTLPALPVASFTWSQQAGTDVRFTDTSSGQASAWTWDFGDGSAPSGLQNPTHTFPSTGSFTVTLTAINLSGSASSGSSVSVAAAPATTSFGPTADSYTALSSPDQNYGTSISLHGKLSSTNEKRPHLTFRVSNLQGRTVSGARLRLFVTDSSPSGGNWYSVSPDWIESGTGSITWNNAPPILDANWVGTIGVATAGTWVELDLSQVIRGEGTYGFAMKTGSSDTVYYASRETTTPPQLVLTLQP